VTQSRALVAAGEERDKRDGRCEEEQRRAAGGGGAGMGGTKSALAVERCNRGSASEGSRSCGARPRGNRVKGGGVHLHSVFLHPMMSSQDWGPRNRALCQKLSQTAAHLVRYQNKERGAATAGGDGMWHVMAPM